jgi:hypothetical protein
MLKPLPNKNLNIELSTTATDSGELINSKLAVKNTLGEDVASIDASGSATFNKINIASAQSSAANDGFGQIVDPEISTNATAGQAIIKAGTTELKISNRNVTPDSLIYITPSSDTQNKVIYVKNKAGTLPDSDKIGYFTAAIDQTVNQDISFNWWIIN